MHTAPSKLFGRFLFLLTVIIPEVSYVYYETCPITDFIFVTCCFIVRICR